MATRAEILERLAGHLTEMFDVPREKITPSARLFDDLGLDSIDAVDLVVVLQDYTGKKMAPAEFKSVRTIGDVVEKLYSQLSEAP